MFFSSHLNPKPTKSYDTVIIGAGVIGTSVAWHLAHYGCRNVLVLDRADQPGTGSTSKATGGFRCQFSTEINVRLSLLSREKLLRFRSEVGHDPGYQPCGYLFVATDPVQLNILREALKVQHDAGVWVAQEVSVEEIRKLNPALYTEDLVGGTFCEWDGFTRPMEILNGYYSASQQLGVEYRFSVERVQVWREGDAVVGVMVDGEFIPTGAVVNAGGAWAAPIAREVGVELPVYPLKRQVAITEPFEALPETMPMSVDVSDGFHLRVRDGRVLLLYPHGLDEERTYEAEFEEAWLPKVLARAHYRVPILREASVDRARCWAGLYEMSPDKHVIVGEAPELCGFYLVNGSSGHGVMHSPALGEMVARLILGMELPFDITPLRPTRFAEGKPNHDTGVL
ncbi:MAG: FAD-binding oxidoreductase [Fimbriimonadales bacterium]